MNVQHHIQKPRGRLSALSPFDPEASAPRPEAGDEDTPAENGASAFGCVEWFRYPDRTQWRPRSRRP